MDSADEATSTAGAGAEADGEAAASTNYATAASAAEGITFQPANGVAARPHPLPTAMRFHRENGGEGAADADGGRGVDLHSHQPLGPCMMKLTRRAQP